MFQVREVWRGGILTKGNTLFKIKNIRGCIMVYLPAKGMKLMRIIHIIAAQIWFGAVVCIFGFAFYCFNNMKADSFLILAPVISRLYRMVVLPAAMVCILQGIMYGVFSKWGFVKFKWVLAKWVMVLFVVICTGAGGIGQMFSIMSNVRQNNIQPVTLNDGKMFFVFMFGQIALLITMTVISIIKPHKNKGK
jgi:hypothetical protein